MKTETHKHIRAVILIIPVLVMLLVLTGCLNGKYDPDLSIGEQIKTRHYDHNAKEFGKNELLDEILEASGERSAARIRALFSDYAVKTDKDLEEQIDQYLDAFPDTVSELYNRGCAEFTHHNRETEEYLNKYQPSVCIVDGNGGKYVLSCIWIERDSTDPGRQGMHSIQLISMRAYTENRFTVHSSDDTPGVYVYK